MEKSFEFKGFVLFFFRNLEIISLKAQLKMFQTVILVIIVGCIEIAGTYFLCLKCSRISGTKEQAMGENKIFIFACV